MSALVAVSKKLVKRFGMESPIDAFPAWAWPGGYPLYYVDHEGCFLCPACANLPENRSLIVDGEVLWEGPALVCDGCNSEIQSAYGDPFCSCGATLPGDPVEVGGVAYCDACASLCELCDQGALREGGLVAAVDGEEVILSSHLGYSCGGCVS